MEALTDHGARFSRLNANVNCIVTNWSEELTIIGSKNEIAWGQVKLCNDGRRIVYLYCIGRLETPGVQQCLTRIVPKSWYVDPPRLHVRNTVIGALICSRKFQDKLWYT